MSRFADAEAGIRQLHARYADAAWRKDFASFGDCFAQDAEWRISGMVLKGRPMIEETIARIMQHARRILITFRTPIIEVGDGTASGRTYITEQCTWDHRDPNVSIGRYYERFVQEGDRWRFTWRVFELHYSGAPDLMGQWHEHPDYGPPPAMPPADALPADHASKKWGLT